MEKHKAVTFTAPPSLMLALAKRAEFEDRSVASAIRQAIAAYASVDVPSLAPPFEWTTKPGPQDYREVPPTLRERLTAELDADTASIFEDDPEPLDDDAADPEPDTYMLRWADAARLYDYNPPEPAKFARLVATYQRCYPGTAEDHKSVCEYLWQRLTEHGEGSAAFLDLAATDGSAILKWS